MVGAYIFLRNFKGLRPGDKERITHAFIAFCIVKDGKGSVDHWEDKNVVRDFIKNKDHLKVVLSVGGWGVGGFSPAVSTPEKREIFAQSLIDIVNDYGFDGIDMDWEYPCDDIAGIEASPEDKPNYTAFIRLLREKLGPNKIVSMAAGAFQSAADNIEIPELAKLMDFINVMTYDIAPWDYVSHHTSLFPSDLTKNRSSHDAIAFFEKAGMPRNKLAIGSAFYGRLYKGVDGFDAPADGPPEFASGYEEAMKIAGENLKYDEKAETAYAYNPKERTFLSFDNPRSIKAKVKYVKDTGLAGIFYWEYTGDTEDSLLLKSMAGK